MLGASLPWRYAIGVTIIAPLTCFILLMMCPESPTWLIFKSDEDEARKALIKLRGHNDMDNDIIIQEEFERILVYKELKLQSEEHQESVLKRVKSMFDPTFVKPFGFLLVLLQVTGLCILFLFKAVLSHIEIDEIWREKNVINF